MLFDTLSEKRGEVTMARKMVWVYKPQAPKFTKDEKTKILTAVKAAMQELPKVSRVVSRLDMRANRIYLYHLVEQYVPEGAILIKPLTLIPAKFFCPQQKS